jgi:hypothetical protein
MPAYIPKYTGEEWGAPDDEKKLHTEDILKDALKDLAIAHMGELAKMRERHDLEYAELKERKDAELKERKDAEPKKLKDAEPKKLKDAEPKKLKDAEPKELKDAESKKLKDAESKKLKDAESKKLKDAESKKLKNAESKKLKNAAPKKPPSFARIMKDTAKIQDDQWQQPGPNQEAWMINPNAWQQPKPQQPKPQQPKPQQPKPQQPKPQLQPIRINFTVEEGPGGTPNAAFSCNYYIISKLFGKPACNRHNCTGRHANMMVNGHCIPIGWLPSHYSKNNIIMDTHTDPNGKGYGHKTCIQWFKHTVTGGYECNGTCGCMHECLSYKDGFKVPVGWRGGQWAIM